jgi:hypothetical protein
MSSRLLAAVRAGCCEANQSLVVVFCLDTAVCGVMAICISYSNVLMYGKDELRCMRLTIE